MTITLENGYTGSMKKKVLIDGILYLENIYEMLTRLHKIQKERWIVVEIVSNVMILDKSIH